MQHYFFTPTTRRVSRVLFGAGWDSPLVFSSGESQKETEAMYYAGGGYIKVEIANRSSGNLRMVEQQFDWQCAEEATQYKVTSSIDFCRSCLHPSAWTQVCGGARLFGQMGDLDKWEGSVNTLVWNLICWAWDIIVVSQDNAATAG